MLKTAPDALPETEVLVPARQFVNSEVDRWRKVENQKLTQRYEHVLAYFDEKLPNSVKTVPPSLPIPAIHF